MALKSLYELNIGDRGAEEVSNPNIKNKQGVAKTSLLFTFNIRYETNFLPNCLTADYVTKTLDINQSNGNPYIPLMDSTTIRKNVAWKSYSFGKFLFNTFLNVEDEVHFSKS